MVFFARLGPWQWLGQGGIGEKKKHGEHVVGEDDLSAFQRCYSHRLALPASEVNGSISVTYVREDFCPQWLMKGRTRTARETTQFSIFFILWLLLNSGDIYR